MRKLALALCVWGAALCAPLTPALAQSFGGSISEWHYHAVSAANTANAVTVDTRNLHSTLAINAVCSSGTAALTVQGDQVSISDTASAITIDTITAAGTQTKQYTPTTVGAGTALSPLSFRWLTISEATCGPSNTSTLDIGMK